MTTKATLIGFSAIAMWGTLPTLATMLGPVPGFLINAITFSIAFGFTLAKWLIRGEPVVANFWLKPRIWLLGFVGIFIYHACYFVAYKSAPPIHCLLIVNLWPLLTVLFAALLLKEKLHWWHICGALCGFAGTGFIVRQQWQGGFMGDYLFGYGLALACALIWSLYSVLCRKWSAELGRDSVGVFCGLTALLSWIIHAAVEPSTTLTPQQWMMLGIMGLGPVGLAFFTWDYGVRHGNVKTLGVLSYCGPLIGAMLLLTFGFAQFTNDIAIAGALILGGAAVGSLDIFLKKDAANHELLETPHET